MRLVARNISSLGSLQGESGHKAPIAALEKVWKIQLGYNDLLLAQILSCANLVIIQKLFLDYYIHN